MNDKKQPTNNKETFYLRVTNNLSHYILWGVYFSLLAVLFPHTAWAFSIFEPDTFLGAVTSYTAAGAFELSIAVLVHKLVGHMERIPKFRGKGKEFKTFKARYLNAYTFSLMLALLVSVLANMAHAVEYGLGKELLIVDEWNVPFGIFVFAFGAFLPLCSILFARVLSNVEDDYETAGSTEIDVRKMTTKIERLLKANRELSAKFKKMSDGASKMKEQLDSSNTSYGQLQSQIGQLAGLMSDDKQIRVRSVYDKWPKLSARAIATVAGVSPSYAHTLITSYKSNGVSNGAVGASDKLNA